MRKILVVFLMVLSLMAAGASANAALMTYEYVGMAPYYVHSCSNGSCHYDYAVTTPLITGTLTIDVAPNFTGTVYEDDFQALSLQSTVVGVNLDLNTAASYHHVYGDQAGRVDLVNGMITNWLVGLAYSTSDYLRSQNIPFGGTNNDDALESTYDPYVGSLGYTEGHTFNFADPYTNLGTWTLVTPTNPTAAPEPSVLMLLGMGLMGLVGLRKKVQK